MMLPGVAPVGGLHARAIPMQAARAGTRAARVAGLVSGHMLAWRAFGLAAFAIAAIAGRLGAREPGAAGVYQFTPDGWATAYAVGIGLIVLGRLAPWHPELIAGLLGPAHMPMGM